MGKCNRELDQLKLSLLGIRIALTRILAPTIKGMRTRVAVGGRFEEGVIVGVRDGEVIVRLDILPPDYLYGRDFLVEVSCSPLEALAGVAGVALAEE